MKLFIAPAHYIIDPSIGSEFTRAFEYIEAVSNDITVTGDVLAGYSSKKQMGNLRIHTLWEKAPRSINIFTKTYFLLWVFVKGLAMQKNNYDTIWHLGPFSVGETFNLLGIIAHPKKKFIIGPIYTPFNPRSMGKKLGKIIRRIFHPLSIATIRSANSIITIEKAGSDLLSNYADKSRVSQLPLTVNETKFRQTKKRKLGNKIKILAVGHLIERKRVEDIIAAISILDKENMGKYTLTIVGGGPEEGRLKELAHRLNVDKIVEFVGKVSRLNVHSYFKNSDIFVSAALAESMPGVYFEAMTSGLPLIVTKNNSSIELKDDNFGGKVVPIKSPNAIATAIKEMVSNTEKYNQNSMQNIRLMNGKYNFARNIASLKELLLPRNMGQGPESVFKKKFIVNYLTVSLLTIFTFACLLASVRGKYGNPNAQILQSYSWKEGGPFELSPERGRYALTSTLVEQKSVYFSSELAKFVTPDLGYYNGHYVSLFAPLLSYMVIPGYILGKILNTAQVGAFISVGIFALINSLLIYKIINRLTLNKLSASISGLVFLFATPAYAYAVNLYQHHATVMFLLASITLLLKKLSPIRGLLILLLCAASISLDYPNVFIFVPIGISLLISTIGHSHDMNRYKISIKISNSITVVGLIIPMVFFLWFNNQSYGSPTTMLGSSKIQSVNSVDNSGNPIFVNKSNERSEESIQAELESRASKSQSSYFEARKLLNGLYITIFSADRGSLYFTPVILLGIIGSISLYKKQKSLTLLLASITVLDLLLYSMWGDPWGGWAFGSRYLIPAYAMLAIFLGVFLDRFRKNIFVLSIFLVLAGYSIYVNTAGALSTSANPPKVQVLELEKLSGRRERYSWDRNIEYLQNGSSKSFVWQTWLKGKISAWDYFRIIAGSISGVVILLTMLLYLTTKENTL